MRVADNFNSSDDDLFPPLKPAEENKNDSLNEAAFYVEEPQLDRLDLSDQSGGGNDQENDMFNTVKRLMTDQHFASNSSQGGGNGNVNERANAEWNQVSFTAEMEQ